MGILQPYVKNFQIAACPSITSIDPFELAGEPEKITVGYTYNPLVAWRTMAVVQAPASIFLVTEGFGHQGVLNAVTSSWFDVRDPYGPNTPYSFGMGCDIYGGFGDPYGSWSFNKIHNGTHNYLYIDGHVKAMKAYGDYRTQPFSDLLEDGSIGGYWHWGDDCPALWVPDAEP